MSKIIKESGPWGEITNYYYEYLDVISQRDALRLELERLKGTTIKISDEGTGCCISCEAYAKELERVYRKLAANHVLELEAENTRWREIAKNLAAALKGCVESRGGDPVAWKDNWDQADEALALYAGALKK